MRNRLPLALVFGAALSCPLALNAQTIDTRVDRDLFAVHIFNETRLSSTLRYIDSGGQTFVAPADRLDDFSFYLSTQSPWDIGPFRFRAYVLPWDESANRPVVGSTPLWTSDTRIGSGDPSGWNGYAAFDFFTGGLALTPGAMYVALLSSVETPADIQVGEWKGNGMAVVDPTASIHGGYVVGWSQTDGVGAGALTSEDAVWVDYYLGPGNAAFRADFSSATPEPATMLLLGSGLAGLAGLRRRRSARARATTPDA